MPCRSTQQQMTLSDLEYRVHHVSDIFAVAELFIQTFCYVTLGRQICGHWVALSGRSLMAVLQKMHR